MQNEKQNTDGLPTYLVIYFLLMALLVSTVVAAKVDMGIWNVVVALAIAVLKALLVMLFFMHVRHSSRLTWIFASAAFLWLGLLIGLTLTDYQTRQQFTTPNSAAQITAVENAGERTYAMPISNPP